MGLKLLLTLLSLKLHIVLGHLRDSHHWVDYLLGFGFNHHNPIANCQIYQKLQQPLCEFEHLGQVLELYVKCVMVRLGSYSHNASISFWCRSTIVLYPCCKNQCKIKVTLDLTLVQT